MLRHPVSLFVEKYPTVCGYTLIQVAEEINRITEAGIGFEGIIKKALEDDEAGQFLARVCLNLQKG
jgi:hypothetical protein